MTHLEKGVRVKTPHGQGEIVDIEHYSRIDGGTSRYGVNLDSNPFPFAVAFYWPKEISIERTASSSPQESAQSIKDE